MWLRHRKLNLWQRRSVTVAALPLGLIAWWVLTGPNPDVVASRLARHIEVQEWGPVYDMMSRQEKSMQPFGRAEFVALMRDVFTHRVGRVGHIQIRGDWNGQTTRKYFHFTFVRDFGGERRKVWFPFPMLRDSDDWHPVIANLPMMMSNLDKRSDRAHFQFVYDACRRTNISSVTFMEERRVYSIDKLGEYLDGKVSLPEVYSSFWQPASAIQ